VQRCIFLYMSLLPSLLARLSAVQLFPWRCGIDLIKGAFIHIHSSMNSLVSKEISYSERLELNLCATASLMQLSTIVTMIIQI
jgi:hypothetical protein